MKKFLYCCKTPSLVQYLGRISIPEHHVRLTHSCTLLLCHQNMCEVVAGGQPRLW